MVSPQLFGTPFRTLLTAEMSIPATCPAYSSFFPVICGFMDTQIRIDFAIPNTCGALWMNMVDFPDGQFEENSRETDRNFAT